MKCLTLIRHADASPAKIGQSDFDRPLSALGTRQAMDQFDELILTNQPKIYFSAAHRTAQTAELLELRHPALEMHPRQDLYNADLDQLIEIIEELWNEHHVVIIAHNPGISQLFYYLTKNWSPFETCSIAQLEYDEKLPFHDISANSKHFSFFSPQTKL